VNSARKHEENSQTLSGCWVISCYKNCCHDLWYDWDYKSIFLSLFLWRCAAQRGPWPFHFRGF